MAKDLGTTVSNWTNGASAGQAKYVQGIEGTTVDPTQLAIRAQGALLANFTQSVTSGRWASQLSKAGKAKWQQSSIDKAGNWSTGISTGATAYSTAMQTWLPRIQSAAATVRNMPSGTLGASQARSAEFMRILYTAKRGG